ncbi:hypothetical protein A2U01_0032973, partial [Trifolium medium]|nr:hypothetical protein [Trifolium medium]
SISNLFKSLDASWSTFLTNIATVVILHVLHSIWMTRNGIRFNNTKVTAHAAKMKILTLIKHSAQLAARLSADAEVQVLQKLFLVHRPTPTITVKMVLWKSPIIGLDEGEYERLSN